jgi:hypothetical protein
MTSPTSPDPILQVSDQILDPQATVDLAYCSMLQGVVTAINSADNTFTANLGGDTSATVSGIKSLLSYQPTVGDTVMCLKQKTDVIGIGKVAVTTAQAYAQAQNFCTGTTVTGAFGSTTAFVNLNTSPNSVTMTKRFSTSNLFVNFSLTGWADVQLSNIMTIAVNIGGTDYICGAINLIGWPVSTPANTSDHGTAVGSTVISGIPAGSVTATMRVRCNNTTGNIHVDTSDFYSLTIREVL